MNITRRQALGWMAATAGVTVLRIPVCAAAGTAPVRLGVITDLHQDVMPDGPARLTAFLDAMRAAQVDLIAQLGDFCVPHVRNRALVELWDQFEGRRLHVVGNHDMDGGYKVADTLKFWGVAASHYTFDAGPLRMLVLDGNDAGGRAGGYHRFIGASQMAWLTEQLAKLDRPALVLVHQPVDHATGGLENGAAVRAALRAHSQAHPDRPVLAVVCGHLHQDYARVVDEVTCLQLNSASYYWVGDAGKSTAYFPPEVQKAHPYVSSVAAYRDPLWALLEVDLAAGELRVQGRRTEWIGPPASQRGVPKTSPDLAFIQPCISDRALRIAAPRSVV